MTARQLPERPTSTSSSGRRRICCAPPARTTPPHSRDSAPCRRSRHSDGDLAHTSLGLHDAQSVIARESGLDSWNALRERVEELTLEFAAAADLARAIG